jgi:hypothetical protein
MDNTSPGLGSVVFPGTDKGWPNGESGVDCELVFGCGGETGSVENASAPVTCRTSGKATLHASAASLNLIFLTMTRSPLLPPKMIANPKECKSLDSAFKSLLLQDNSAHLHHPVAQKPQVPLAPALF